MSVKFLSTLQLSIAGLQTGRLSLEFAILIEPASFPAMTVCSSCCTDSKPYHMHPELWFFKHCFCISSAIAALNTFSDVLQAVRQAAELREARANANAHEQKEASSQQVLSASCWFCSLAIKCMQDLSYR